MSDEILNYIIFLENTVASFYQRIKEVDELRPLNSVLEFMETHSSEHAEFIKETIVKYAKPHLDDRLIIDYQNEINRKVLNKIIDEDDRGEVLQILANAEESIGKLYDKITDHLTKTSEYYKSLSEAVKKIACEEYDHRDILLRNREKLLKKK
jgi:truncated hemoglobin YjbI